MHEVVLINSKNNTMKLELGELFFQGGPCSVIIKSGNYQVKGDLWITLGELRRFYDSFKDLYKSTNGTAILYHSDMALTAEFIIDLCGNVKISGKYRENPAKRNELHFRMVEDLHYLEESMDSMKNLFEGRLQTEREIERQKERQIELQIERSARKVELERLKEEPALGLAK